MIVPAITYKEEIEQQFKKIQYTDKYLWYTGSIDNYDIEVKTEADKFAFAIVCQEHLIGYISFRVDWYCSMAYNFGLIRFSDAFVEIDGVATRTMADAIREVIRMLRSFKLHRIDFRCIDGNPAEKKYYKIIYSSVIDQEYYTRVVRMVDNIKDVYGEYHDTLIYELIRR